MAHTVIGLHVCVCMCVCVYVCVCFAFVQKSVECLQMAQIQEFSHKPQQLKPLFVWLFKKVTRVNTDTKHNETISYIL